MKTTRKILSTFIALPLLSLSIVSCKPGKSSSSFESSPSDSSPVSTQEKVLFLGRNKEEASYFLQCMNVDPDPNVSYVTYTEEDTNLLSSIQDFSSYKQIVLSSFDFTNHADLLSPLSKAVKSGVSLFTIGAAYNSTSFTKTPKEIVDLLPVNFAYDEISSHCFVIDTSSALATHLDDLKTELKTYLSSLPLDDRICFVTKEKTTDWIEVDDKTNWESEIDSLGASNSWSLAPLTKTAKEKLESAAGNRCLTFFSASLPSDKDAGKEAVLSLNQESYPKNFINMDNTDTDHTDYLLSLERGNSKTASTYALEHFDKSDSVLKKLHFEDTVDYGKETTFANPSDPSIIVLSSLPAFDGYTATAKDGAKVILKNNDVPRYVKKGNVASFLGSLYREEDGLRHVLFDSNSLVKNSAYDTAEIYPEGALFLRRALADNR